MIRFKSVFKRHFASRSQFDELRCSAVEYGLAQARSLTASVSIDGGEARSVSVPSGCSIVDVADAIGVPSERVLAATVSGGGAAQAWLGGSDVHARLVDDDVTVELAMSEKSDASRAALAHTAAHVLGEAIERVHVGALLRTGPFDASGAFSYGAELSGDKRALRETDLEPLEAEMRALLDAAQSGDALASEVARKAVPVDVARALFASNRYKVALIDALEARGATHVGVVASGANFVDLCAGPHRRSLRAVRPDALTLTAVGGTHERGEQRVRGVAFATAAELRAWRRARDEAAARDHRRVGQEQELFMFSEHSPGGVMWLPDGQRVRLALVRALRREYRLRGFDEVSTPQVFDEQLWRKSGHWDNYRDDMFEVVDPDAAKRDDDKRTFLKPMNW